MSALAIEAPLTDGIKGKGAILALHMWRISKKIHL
jgi:hypothetical protein